MTYTVSHRQRQRGPDCSAIPHLIELVENGTFDPGGILTQIEPLTAVMNAYEAFDNRRPNWMKVETVPGG